MKPCDLLDNYCVLLVALLPLLLGPYNTKHSEGSSAVPLPSAILPALCVMHSTLRPLSISTGSCMKTALHLLRLPYAMLHYPQVAA